jgi:3-deoxy-D-manno-octulosonate 8-phosphate phosphatase (KDO 8-P phosphatase)
MSALPPRVRALAAEVALVVLDVDGVLTDGTLYYGADGEVLKAFHVRDGLGVRVLLREGIEVAVISGRRSAALERRLGDLGITHAYLGRDDKGAAFDELLEATGVPASRTAHVGDDIIDLPLLRRVALPIAVCDAHPLALEAAAHVTTLPGGKAVVREVADLLLEARGRLPGAYEDLLAALHSTKESK